MKVLLAVEDETRATQLRNRLTEAGCAVFVDMGQGSLSLGQLVSHYRPDVLLIDHRFPTRDSLNTLFASFKDMPLPVVLSAETVDAEQARLAISVGAHALLVGLPSGHEMAPVLEAACAQFSQIAHLKAELGAATRLLNERKTIERAKGMLMQQRQLVEEDAYKLMRRTAMEKKLKLVAVAEQIITVTEMGGI